MNSTIRPSKADLRKALEDEVRLHRSVVAAAAKLQSFHTDLLDRAVRALAVFDTPKLPNLFPECPQTPSNQAPTESRPSAS